MPDRVGRHDRAKAGRLAHGLKRAGDLPHPLAAKGHNRPLGRGNPWAQPIRHGDDGPALLGLLAARRVEPDQPSVEVALEARQLQHRARPCPRADQQGEEHPDVIGHVRIPQPGQLGDGQHPFAPVPFGQGDERDRTRQLFALESPRDGRPRRAERPLDGPGAIKRDALRRNRRKR